MRPYLEELRDVWPWLLLAGLCGVLVTIVTAVSVVAAKQRKRGLPWLHTRRWKNLFALPERKPLLWNVETVESNPHNYHTTMWGQSTCCDTHMWRAKHCELYIFSPSLLCQNIKTILKVFMHVGKGFRDMFNFLPVPPTTCYLSDSTHQILADMACAILRLLSHKCSTMTFPGFTGFQLITLKIKSCSVLHQSAYRDPTAI